MSKCGKGNMMIMMKDNGANLCYNRSLHYLFDTLKQHGSKYPAEFWTTITRQIVFPLFDDLKPNSDHHRHMTPEDLSVWVSTTMIEALRNVVDLYTYYFDNMKGMMRHVLGLFGVCITQGKVRKRGIDEDG